MSLELIYENMLLLEYSEQQALQLLQQSKTAKQEGYTPNDINDVFSRLKWFLPLWEEIESDIPQGSINKTYLNKTKQATLDSNILYQLVFWFIKKEPVIYQIWSGIEPADLRDRLSMYKTYLLNKVYFNQINKNNKSLLNINGHRTYNDFLNALRQMYEITQGSVARDDVSSKDLGKWYSNPNVKLFMQSGEFTCFETKTFEGTKDFIYNIFNYDRSKNYEYGEIEDGYHPYCTGTYERYWDQYSRGSGKYKQYWIFKNWPYGEKIPTPPPTETDIGFVGKKYLHSMQDSWNDYLDREDGHIQHVDIVDTDLLRILTKIPYLELNEYNIYDLSPEKLLDRMTYNDVINNSIQSILKDKLSPFFNKKDIPKKLKDLIYEYIEAEGTYPYFAGEWVSDMIYGPEGPSEEMLERIGIYIKETSKCPMFITTWINERVNEDNELPKEIFDAVITLIIRQGKIPEHSGIWRYFTQNIFSGTLPQEAKNAIYYYIRQNDRFPTFAEGFLKKELESGYLPETAFEALYYQIRKRAIVPPFAYNWVAEVLKEDNPPEGLKESIYYILKGYIGSHIPDMIADWVLLQLKKDPIPKDILDSIYNRIRQNVDIPWFLRDFVKDMLDSDDPPEKLIDSLMSSIRVYGVTRDIVEDYVYRKLYEEETPEMLKRAIYAHIENFNGNVSEVLERWLTNKLIQGQVPSDVLNMIIDNYHITLRFPEYIKNWIRDPSVWGTIPKPFHRLIKYLIMTYHTLQKLPLPFKNIIEDMIDNDNVPEWLDKILSKYTKEYGKPPMGANPWYANKRLKESKDVTTFKKYWGL